ncbi:hypothetical protein Rhopal_005504-T1 [Rhodotorula paludigena]|uniref:Auxin efflux carrier n=1 Tax=Rhodotorula paludigena TaxID=86838 RepID=A0AAV5GRB4_9BASI|nr:hypothetical protein Rhopal_005504-T1 [Rhodotorula paludigena]
MSDSVPPVNELIWISVKPILKLAIPASLGFWMTRAGLFPVAAARGASQIILNVALPSLLFSKITPSINGDNAKAIGPIFLVGIIYMILSLLMGIIVRVLFPTPRNFRWGLLAAATWSNWGDLPTSVVQTVCASAPFSGQADADLAVAYVAIFILIFYITLFPMRGIHLIERDYTHPPRELTDEEKEEHAARGPLHSLRVAGRNVGGLVRRRRGGRVGVDDEAAAPAGATATDEAEEKRSTTQHPLPTFSPLHRQTTSRSIDSASVREIAGAAHAASPPEVPGQFLGATATPVSELMRTRSFGQRHVRHVLAAEQRARLQPIAGSRAVSVADDEDITEVGTQMTDDTDERTEKKEMLLARTMSPPSVPEDRHADTSFEREKGDLDHNVASSEVDNEDEPQRGRAMRWLISVKGFVLSLLTPPTISLVIALICALVNPLKALFVTVPDYGWNPTAPDGLPPLSILLDTATFIGNASVPLGLLVLGSTLGRMEIPRPISRLPLYSIFGLALCKVVILPIIGYLFVRALTLHTNLIDEDNHVLQFVMIFFSVVPTATTQCALTVIFAPEDGENNSSTLSAHLITQYFIFAFTSVILTAITLRTIF